jgi:hypothetical protein
MAPTPFTLAIFSKPIGAITAEDVYRVASEHVPEDDATEFKERLPAKKGKVDPWGAGGEAIGEYARNEILEEVVAFANAHGGHVLLGIEESEDHPKRAVRVCALPRCADLAARLLDQARSCVEPPLSVLEVRGIPTATDAGVVLLRVPESRLAPHRVIPTGACTLRRGDSTTTMTMREIQDLTLQRAAGTAALEAAFAERRALRESQLLAEMQKSGRPLIISARATLIPAAGELRVPRAQIASFHPCYEPFVVADRGGTTRLQLYQGSLNPRPILRGRRWTVSTDPSAGVQIDVTENGLVEYAFSYVPFGNQDDVLNLDMALGLSANALSTAHVLRLLAGAPATEYAVEFELRCQSGAPLRSETPAPLFITRVGGSQGSRIGPLEYNPLLPPRFSFGAFGEMRDIIGRIASDCLNAGAAGCEPETHRVVGPTGLLEAIEQRRVANAAGQVPVA